MRKRNLQLLALFAAFALLLTGCKIATGYPQFCFDGIGKAEPEAYLTEEGFSGLRVGDFAVVPMLKVVYTNTYAMDFVGYSYQNDVSVTLRHIELGRGDEVLLSEDIDLPFSCQAETDGVSEYVVRALCVPIETLNPAAGEVFCLKAVACVEAGGATQEAELAYTAQITQYKTLVFPT